ncbi:MAG: SUMF1/EgtB/PvdO family nonheme iron enzyme [Candidatus Saganbacteria bacterium]|nr:SUMF1/EgtB/PvdO family nonheme iron enzyme [Candidatus Saganbacteria bacterium]
MCKSKLISFNIRETLEQPLPEARGLHKRLKARAELDGDGKRQLAVDLRRFGFPIVLQRLEDDIRGDRVEGLIEGLWSAHSDMRDLVMDSLLPRIQEIISAPWRTEREEYNFAPRFRKILERVGIVDSAYDDFAIQKRILRGKATNLEGTPSCAARDARYGMSAIDLVGEIIDRFGGSLPKDEIFLLRLAGTLFETIDKVEGSVQNLSPEGLEGVAEVILRALERLPEMVKVRGNHFGMGDQIISPPPRNIKISAFKISRHPITYAEYQKFLVETGNASLLPSDPAKLQHPVADVSWHDAVAYCEWLSHKTGRQYRLPTEAEWEYAARGKGRISRRVDSLENIVAGAAHSTTRPVGERPAGARWCGAEDMLGQVSEWCLDWYGPYDSFVSRALGTELVDPHGPAEGTKKVMRGGNFTDNSRSRLTSVFRAGATPDSEEIYIGFRVVEVIEDA